MSAGRSSQDVGLLLGGAHEVLDVVEVDARQVGAPGRHRLAARTAAGPCSRMSSIHCGSLFLRGDVADDVLVQAAARRGAGGVGVGPAVLVACRGLRARGSLSRWWSSMRVPSGDVGALAGRPVAVAGIGMKVVQTPSPWAMVASRWTWVPSSSAKASVSASHSCGNSLGDVRDRAVVLAQLLAGRWEPCRSRGARRRTRPRSSSLGEQRRPLLGGYGVHPRPGTGRPARATRLRANASTAVGRRAVGEELQRVDGQLVVRLVEDPAAAVGEREDLGRTAPAPLPVRPLLPRLDQVLGQQRIQVTPHAGGRHLQPLPEIHRGRGAVGQNAARDPVTRTDVHVSSVVGRRRRTHGLVRHAFHNTSVPLFVPAHQVRET